jgi:hypothetical protein
MRTAGGAFETEQQLLREALAIRAKGMPTPGSTEALQLQSIAAKLQPVMQATHGFKRLSGKDEEVNQQAMGNPGAILFGDRADQALRDLIRTSGEQEQNTYAAKGLAAGRVGYDPITGQRKAYYKGYDLPTSRAGGQAQPSRNGFVGAGQ